MTAAVQAACKSDFGSLMAAVVDFSDVITMHMPAAGLTLCSFCLAAHRTNSHLAQVNAQLERLTRESTAAERKHQQEQQQLKDKLSEVERQLAHKEAEAAAATRQADQQQGAFQKLMADHEALKANSTVRRGGGAVGGHASAML
jgi:septal ring factor EnvC (AmiA/AmiB activator)